MSNHEPQSYASTTIARDENGDIQRVKCRAEYYEVNLDADENADDRYLEGASAKFKFKITEDLAYLSDVGDIDDGRDSGYETSLGFLRAVAIAEQAVANVPGIEHVQDTEERIFDELERGRSALDE